jgi:hypothetical protein
MFATIKKVKMKKLVSVLCFLSVLLASGAYAQGIRLNAYSSYVFDDKVDSYYDQTDFYNGTIKGGYQWGAGIEFMPHSNYGVEIMYLRQNTTAPLNYYNNGVKFTNFDLGINYIMLAGNRYFSKPGGKVEGFAGGMLGVDVTSVKNPTNSNKTTKTFFSWGFRGGANIWVTEKVGIKLQAQLLSAVQSVGGGFYFGTGGAGAGLSTQSSMYQFGLGGGLAFKFPGTQNSSKPGQLR